MAPRSKRDVCGLDSHRSRAQLLVCSRLRHEGPPLLAAVLVARAPVTSEQQVEVLIRRGEQLLLSGGRAKRAAALPHEACRGSPAARTKRGPCRAACGRSVSARVRAQIRSNGPARLHRSRPRRSIAGTFSARCKSREPSQLSACPYAGPRAARFHPALTQTLRCQQARCGDTS